ncbi:hypothetical protein [Acinetobacter indicus]|uniref:hypothetical protein n=1 Tax=Acinetobacter indicus TaxID=756892 RepID=UPI00209A6D13|nr:hypothetical protein [Acinetobacter indicus]MCO8100935.1 hypothetical protein [Acinetobacter indicus]MCO8106520.1 hypothetical protein [Acinetobacter indicus]MCO8112225.1 hypothetical protein [Acinetobacter indicus]
MKKTTLTALLLALINTGCHKQPAALPEHERTAITKQFEDSDEKLTAILIS